MIFSLTILAFIFIAGLVVGSFLNVVILRTVSDESIVAPASKCPKCQTPLKWYHNIPVLSYIFLRGKCAFCNEKISIQYPLVELFTGIIFVGLFLRFCNPFDPLFGLNSMNPITVGQILVYIFSLVVASFFIAIAGTDILEKKVSDLHTFGLIGVGIVYSIVYAGANLYYYTKALGLPKFDLNFFLTCPVLYSVSAGILGYLIMEAFSRLGLAFAGKRAFGEGDSLIAGGLGTVFGSLIGCSPLYRSFIPVFQFVVVILVLSGIIQIIITLPMFVKKLVKDKNWLTLGSIIVFGIYTISYIFAQNYGWLTNRAAYYSSTVVLILLGLLTCRELLCGLKENKSEGMYLPFGPSMIIAGFIALFTIAL